MPRPPITQAGLAAFAPAARRTMTVFGATAELVLVPGRAARGDRANHERPAFRRSPAGRIVDEESLWRDGPLAVTPNRYPFGEQQRLLWPTTRGREPDLAFWCAAGEWVDAANGSALLNTIGAAATIARAHAHLLPECLPFLRQLPELRSKLEVIDLPPGVELLQKQVPFCLLGVRGEAAARAEAVLRLAEARLSAAWNVVVQDRTAWVFARSEETPAPHFPQALGAAELWGRWCYTDAAAFEAATAADLEQALVCAGRPPVA